MLMYDEEDLSRIRCYVCNKLGHLACMAPLAMETCGSLACYKCGGTDHSGADCTFGDSYVGARSFGYKDRNAGLSCYRCKQFGHIARDCTADMRGINQRQYNNQEQVRTTKSQMANEYMT